MFLIDSLLDVVEDLEWFRQDGNIICYYSARIDEWMDGEVHVVLEPIQVIDESTDQSPVGCNSCDLGDHTLPHKTTCPVEHILPITLVVKG